MLQCILLANVVSVAWGSIHYLYTSLNPGPAYGFVEFDWHRNDYYWTVESDYYHKEGKNGNHKAAICDEGLSFTYNDALVICREQSFDGVLNYWSQEPDSACSGLDCIGPVKNFMDCDGPEYQAFDCIDDYADDKSLCTTKAVVFVQCKNWILVDDPTKLLNGDPTKPHTGILSHFFYGIGLGFSGFWGPVCSSGWTRKEADALCRTLLYMRGARDVSFHSEELGSHDAWVINNLTCDAGSEMTLDLCTDPQRQKGSPLACLNKSTVVGVTCNVADKDLRLVPGPYSGRLEIYDAMSDTWGTICSDDWLPSTNNVLVACGQLGLHPSSSVRNDDNNETGGLNAVFLNHVRCVGNETMLSDCPNDGWLMHSSCELQRSVSVFCQAAGFSCGRGFYSQPDESKPDHGCVKCPPGTYQETSDTNSLWCDLCALGTYTADYGSISCARCGIYVTTLTLGATKEEDCLQIGTNYAWCNAGHKCDVSLTEYRSLRPNTHRLGIFAGDNCGSMSVIPGSNIGPNGFGSSNSEDSIYVENNQSFYDYMAHSNASADVKMPIHFVFYPFIVSGGVYLLCFCDNILFSCNNPSKFFFDAGYVRVYAPKLSSVEVVRGWKYAEIPPHQTLNAQGQHGLDFGFSFSVAITADHLYLMRNCKLQQTISVTDRSPTGRGVAVWRGSYAESKFLTFSFDDWPINIDVGNYELCWCRKDDFADCTQLSDFAITTVLITVKGVRSGQEISCFIGQDCYSVEDLESLGPDENDRLAVQDSCGAETMIKGMPGDGIYKREWPELVPGKFVVAKSSSTYSLYATTGLYRLCFCRIAVGLPCEKGFDFTGTVGLFLAQGPYIAATLECKIGTSGCLQRLSGLNLGGGDQIKIFALSNDAHTCMDASGDVSSHNLPSREFDGSYSNGTLTFDFGVINSTGVPGMCKMCWRPRPGTVSRDAGFQAFVGYISFSCPQGFYQRQDMNTGQETCRLCPVGYYCAGGDSTTPAVKVRCPVGSTTVDVGRNVSADCVCKVGMVRKFTVDDQMTCIPCPVGTYQPSVSSTSACLPCPTNRSNVGTTDLSGCLCMIGEIDTNSDPNVFDCRPLDADTANEWAQSGASQVARILPIVQGSIETILPGEVSMEDLGLLRQALVQFLASQFDLPNRAINVTSSYPSSRLLTRQPSSARGLQASDNSTRSLEYSILMSSDAEAAVAMGAGISLIELTAAFKTSLPSWALPLAMTETVAMARGTKIVSCSEEVAEGYAFPFGIRVTSIDDCVCAMGWQLIVVEGEKKCTPCPLGTYKSTIGYETCASCGMTMCDDPSECPDLTTPAIGATSKLACICSRGYYSPNTTKPSECVPCGFDYFCDGGSARRQCRQDAFTRHSTTASKEADCFCSVQDSSPGRAVGLDCSCEKDYYKTEVSGLPMCQPCPEKGMTCAGGFTDNYSWPGTHSYPVSQPGYYMTDYDKSARCILAVEKQSVCLGGQPFRSVEKQCVKGHVGPFCGTCELYYTRDGQKAKDICGSCSELGESSAIVTSIVGDMIVKVLWGIFLGQRSLASLGSLQKVDAIVLRMAMQWFAVCSVLKQFNLQEIEIYGWNAERLATDAAASEAPEPANLVFLELPPWFEAIWETLFGFVGSLPDLAPGTTQENLECLVVRHLSTENIVRMKAVVPIIFWLSYPFLLCILLVICGLIAVKVIYPLWIVSVRCMMQGLRVKLVNMGADPQSVDASITTLKLSDLSIIQQLLNVKKNPLRLMDLVGVEVMSQIMAHRFLEAGVEPLLKKAGKNNADLMYSIKLLLEGQVKSKALGAAGITKVGLMSEMMKAWRDPRAFLELICRLVVLEADMCHIQLNSGSRTYLRRSPATSTLVQSSMQDDQEGLRWKVERVPSGGGYWLMKCVGGKVGKHGCILSVNSEGNDFTFEEEDRDERQRWIITEHQGGGYTFKIKIGSGEDRFISFEAKGTKVFLGPTSDENTCFALGATFDLGLEMKGDAEHLMLDFDEVEVDVEAEDYSEYVVFGIFRQGNFMSLLVDLLPFMFIMMYSVWDTLTRRYFLGLQTMVVYIRDDQNKYRPAYIWQTDTRWEVFDREHWLVGILSLIGLTCVSLGFLMGLLLFIRKSRKNLMNPDVFRLVGFFFNGLEPNRYYWELGVKRVDVLLVYVTTYTQALPDINAKLVIYSLLAGSAWVLHATFTPYDDRLNGLLDKIEYDTLRSRFFLFAMIQILIVFGASKTQSFILTFIILVSCLKTIVLLACYWLLEVFGGGEEEEPDEHSEETLGRGIDDAMHLIQESTPAFFGTNPITRWVMQIARPLLKIGLSTIIKLLPSLLLRPLILGRRLATSSVPRFQYRPSTGENSESVVVIYRVKDKNLPPLYKIFLRSVVGRFYGLRYEEQFTFALQITGKFWDHLVLNVGIATVTSDMGIIYMLACSLVLAGRRFGKVEAVTQAAVLAQARFLAKMYRNHSAKFFGPDEGPIVTAMEACTGAKVIDEEEVRKLPFAITAEQLHGAFLWLLGQPYDSLKSFIPEFRKVTCDAKARLCSDVVQETSGLDEIESLSAHSSLCLT